MKKQEVVKRVTKFLNKNLRHVLDKMEDPNSKIENHVLFDNYQKPYFIYSDQERKGCFESEESFVSKEDLNNIIKSMFIGSGIEKPDQVFIFDVKKNKRVYPRI